MLHAEDILEDVAPFAGDSGLCPDSKEDEIYKHLNDARRLLWNRGDWMGTVEFGCLNADECFAYLPWHLKSVRKAWYGKHPITVRNQWYEGLSFAGLQSCCSCECHEILDTGTRSPIMRQMPKGYRIMVQPFGDEEEGTMLRVTSRDQRGVTQSESFDLSKGAQTGEANVYSVEAVAKAATEDSVSLFAVSGDNKVELAFYHPEQTNPSYTVYKVTFSPKAPQQILIKAKKKFWKITKGDDLVGIENVTALQLAMQAKSAQLRDDPENFAIYLRMAEENLEEDIEDEHTNPFEPLDVQIEGAVPNLKSRFYNEYLLK